MIFLALIAVLSIFTVFALVFNNMQLRKHNDELRQDNHQLFMKDHRAQWDIEFLLTELRLTEAEYGIKNNTKRRAYHGTNSVVERQRVAH
jgi:hypothetical protein